MRVAWMMVLAACGQAAAPDKPDTPPIPPAIDAPPLAPDAPIDAFVSYPNLCAAPAPAGSPTPDRPALPAGGCPTLVPGMNTLASGRSFLLVVPADRSANETL